MLSGDNGILQRATDAKTRTEKAQIIETAQTDILGKQAENHGSLSAEELEQILTSPDYNTQGFLSGEDSILDRTLTSKDGKYTIPVSQIYNGKLTDNNSGLNIEKLKSILEKSSEDGVQINEKGEISSIVWPYSTINKDECYIYGEKGDGDDESYNDYYGSITDGKLENDFPIFIKEYGEIYKVTKIGAATFAGLSQLAEINIPNTITEIDEYAFANCGLKSITIPNGVKQIPGHAFDNCAELTNINIPNSVTEIGYSAFGYCRKLLNIEIPDSVIKMSPSAFNGTAWYNSQANGMLYLGKVAYCYKGKIPENTNIELKNNTISIAGDEYEKAFNSSFNCSGMISITIPNSVAYIPSDAFSECTGLTSIKIDKSINSIDNAPWGAPNMTANDVTWAE